MRNCRKKKWLGKQSDPIFTWLKAITTLQILKGDEEGETDLDSREPFAWLPIW